MSESALARRFREAGLDWIVPSWRAPPAVCAFVTTREGGVSSGEFATMNLGRFGGDDPTALAENHRRVEALLPSAPVWMDQVHGIAVATLDRASAQDRTIADAAVTRESGVVAAVLTADCLPVLFADSKGRAVGIAHAGWRGLAAGVLETTIDALAGLGVRAADLSVWLGPGIGPDAFEVGAEVRDAFCAHDPGAAICFAPHVPGKWHADLYALARLRLTAIGVTEVTGGGFCTVTESSRFFSYRRARDSGRMATLIWLDAASPTPNV